MKIYFDGCSWTMGAELENPEKERFSKLLCNELGAEETNLAIGGGSNDRIVRNLLIEHNIEDYDLAIIQMTYPARTEYYDVHSTHAQNNWVRVNPKHSYSTAMYEKIANFQLKEGKFTEKKAFWREYYTDITNQEFFDNKEKIHFQTIKNHCEVKKVPLMILTINQWTKTSAYQLNLPRKRDFTYHPYGHPTKETHRLIADDIAAWTDPSRKPRILKKAVRRV